MSRQSMLPSAPSANGAPRQLSLTEELEKLEQSITLTLQEIDHNFNQCHRIVTHSIIPVIERFSDESNNVNEGSRFWKHFFEGSANVSIGTYEVHPEDEETTVMTGENEETFTQSQYTQGSSPITYNKSRSHHEHHEDDSSGLDLENESILASMNLTGAQSHSTPRQNKKLKSQNGQARWANMESPYETMRKEINSREGRHQQQYTEDDSDSSLPVPFTSRKYDTTDESTPQAPTTPESIRPVRGQRRMLDSPDSSPYQPQPTKTQPPPSTTKRSKNDILLHRAVDTNWRLQATPINPFKNAQPAATTPRTARKVSDEDSDSDLFSSPVPPQLTTVISPLPQGKIKSAKKAAKAPMTPNGPSSARPKTTTTTTAAAAKYDFPDSDSDDDDLDMAGMGFSPPVTMQFSLPPSKLMQTPAREASKRMVKDIMQSAGLGRNGEFGEMTGDTEDTTTTGDGYGDGDSFGEPDSPSMVGGREMTDDFLRR